MVAEQKNFAGTPDNRTKKLPSARANFFVNDGFPGSKTIALT